MLVSIDSSWKLTPPQADGLAGLLQWMGGGLATGLSLYTNILPYLPPRHTETRARCGWWGVVRYGSVYMVWYGTVWYRPIPGLRSSR